MKSLYFIPSLCFDVQSRIHHCIHIYASLHGIFQSHDQYVYITLQLLNRESPFSKMAAVDESSVLVAGAIADIVRLCGFDHCFDRGTKLSIFKVYLSRLPLFLYTHHVLERDI